MAEIISRHTGRYVETVMEDIDRDRFMTPPRPSNTASSTRSCRRSAPVVREVASALMDMRGIHHVGVAVADLDEAIATYDALLGATLEHRALVADQGVEAAVVLIGGGRVELLAPTGPMTPVGRFLAKRGPGMHHIAYEVDDVGAALAELAAGDGVELIDAAPARACSASRSLRPSGPGRWRPQEVVSDCPTTH